MPDLWMDVDTALSEVPVNIMPLIDDTDFKSIEGAIAYNAAGMALYWHFVTTGGAYTVTAVTPTTAGNYDWTDQGAAGIYTIEIPASGGASINNDTEGFGWFTGVCTGVLPWRGPTIGFRAAGLNNLLIDDAYSTTRGLAGTALPAAAADAAGGLIISDAGGLDADAQLVTKINDILTDTGTTLQGELDGIQADTEDIQTRLPAALVSGRIDASVGAMAANVLTASAINADAITAAKLAADVTTELQSGLATASALSTVAGYLDTEIAAILADTNELQTDWADGGRLDLILDARASQTSVDDIPTVAEFEARTIAAASYATATALDAVDNFIDTEISAIITTLGTPAGASISADIAAIEAQTDDIGTAGAGLTAVPWNAAWDAEVQSEVQDAIEANNLDHLVKVAVDTNFATTVHLDSVIGQLADNGTTATFDRTTDSLEALQGVSAPSAASIADAVWEEAIADHSGTTGSTAEALNAAGAAGDPWTTALPGAYGAGSAGKIIGDNINATISSRASQTSVDTIDDLLDTEVAAIKSDTAAILLDTGTDGVIVASIANNAVTAAAVAADAVTEIQSGLATAANLSTVAGYLDTEIAAILEDTGTTIPAQISALNNISAAQVNTEVDTALSDVGLTTTITGRIDAAISTRLASASYTAPDNASITSILADTNELQGDWVNGGRLDLILDARASQTSVDDIPTNAELSTALGTADDATLAAIAALNNLSSAQVTAAVPTAAQNAAAVLAAATANPIDANIQEVNDVAITGDGDATPWGPA